MADFPIPELAASARALLAASPFASREATATKKSTAWRMLTDDGGSAQNGGVDSTRTVDNNNGSIDLEAGLELSHSVGEIETAALTNVESTDEATATDSTPTTETTSDVGNGITAECA